MSIELANSTSKLLTTPTIEKSSTSPANDNSDLVSGFAQDFDVFLSILTTQLTNQNPLDPLDADKFTSQLTEFATVEQSIGTNTRLDELKTLVSNQEFDSAVSYVNKKITYDSNSGWNEGNGVNWHVALPEATDNVQITISDSSGNVVFEQNASFANANKSIYWNGHDSSGNKLAAGNYSIEVDAYNTNGDKHVPLIRTDGRVTAAEVGGASPGVMVGQIRVPLKDISHVGADSAATAEIIQTEDE